MTIHHDTPPDIRGLSARLAALGALERAGAEDAVTRTTMRTAHLLTDRRPAAARGLAAGLRGVWLWFAAPAVAAAAVLIGLAVMAPRSATNGAGGGVEVLAASIESDIDAWMELDSIWRGDSFETNLTAISIDAAGLNTRADSYDVLPVLDSER